MIKILKVSKVYYTIVFLFVLCAFIPSCNVSTAKITSSKVCTSLSGSECAEDNSAIPASSQVIYCSAKLENAPSGTKITFSWKHNGEAIGSADVETGSGTIYSNLNSNGSLEPGKYSVTLKINTDNSQPITKEFIIE